MIGTVNAPGLSAKDLTAVKTALETEIEAGKTECAENLAAAKTELTAQIETAAKSASAYSQVTKLDTCCMKGLLLPVEATEDYCRPPLEILKLRDDGISVSVTACDFDNGDAADFQTNDNVEFKKGRMRPKKHFDITMTTPVALGSGYISESETIDLSLYVDIQEVRIA